MWRKFSETEDGTRVPLLIYVPSLPQSHGRVVQSPVELVDVFRTVHDILDIEVPQSDQWSVEGTSLLPALVADSTQEAEQYLLESHPNGALSMYARCPTNESIPWQDNWCEFVERSRFPVMGHAIRNASFRYVEWRRWDGEKMEADWSKEALVGVELYDHRNDTGTSFDVEMTNQVDQYPQVAQEFAKQMPALFRGWVPTT